MVAAVVNTIRNVVGIIGNIISLFLFLSPVPTFVEIVKKGRVEQYSAAPYLATLINCMVWVLYGLPMVHPHSTLVITINASGTTIELVYIILFLLYSDKKKRIKVISVLVVELIFIALVALLVLTLLHSTKQRSMAVGIICILFNIMMYASPLSVMKLVITTKSVEYMPFYLSLMSLANGVAWTTYAFLPFDQFIAVIFLFNLISCLLVSSNAAPQFACLLTFYFFLWTGLDWISIYQIPNGLGTLFGVAQLVLYACYYKSTKRQMEARQGKGQVDLSAVVVSESNSGDSKKTGTAVPDGG